MASLSTRRRVVGVSVMIGTYLLAQAVMVLLHEHLHSTSAWLLGYSRTPFTVVWGNLLTLQGWDEGVPYDRLFPAPGNPAEAVIGGSPLLMHAVFVLGGLWLLTRMAPERRPLLFTGLYWFLTVNLAELVAYLVMRPFIRTGDTGRFNHGLDLSPWVLFVGGLAFLAVALWAFRARVAPAMDRLTDASRLEHWTVVTATAFVLFLWASGLRFLALYPDPQWKACFIGIAGFGIWLLADGLHRTKRRA